MIPMSEVRRHCTARDCWVVINGRVYELTGFLSQHPGGKAVILQCAGGDASREFNLFHNRDIIRQMLAPEACRGEVDPTTIKSSDIKPTASRKMKQREPSLSSMLMTMSGGGGGGGEYEDDAKEAVVQWRKPPLEHILNLRDFVPIAQKCMNQQGWDYYCSGCDDEITLAENEAAFRRYWFRPRVLVNVKNVDPSVSILGHDSAFPVYITSTALGRLAHPEGEVVLTRAAGRANIVQLCPTLASCTLEEMAEARVHPDQVQFYQLYVNANRNICSDIVRRVEEKGYRALFITVDAPQLGRRERDMRNKFTLADPAHISDDADADADTGSGAGDGAGSGSASGTTGTGEQQRRKEGVARAISGFIDPSLSWDDISMFQSLTHLPIVLKGVQCGDDAVRAARMGVKALVLSNHGGRQLEFSRAAIDVLPEVVIALRHAGYIPGRDIEIYIDGGIRRGTDVVKALCLGATAVGIGRPVLYGLAGYGEDGVARVLSLLRGEIEMAMRLLGVTRLEELRPDFVMARPGEQLRGCNELYKYNEGGVVGGPHANL